MSDPNARDPLAPQPLNYQPPRDDLPRRKRERHRAIAGGMLSFLAVFWSLFVLVLSSLNPEGGSSPTNFAIASIFILPVAAALIITAIYQWRRHGSKSFLLGGLIGIGVAALVEGACFMITRG